MLGLTRSAFGISRAFARGLWFELLLALASALLFALLYDGSLIGGALAIWGFWLAQSAFALLPPSAQASPPAPRDPFETAAAAAEQLMERRG